MNEPQWEIEYSARDAYNLTSLLPEAWDELTQRFAQDAQLVEKYYYYHYTSHPPGACDAKCQKMMVC